MHRYFFGEWKEGTAPLSVAEVAALCAKGRAAAAELAAYPMDKVLRLLGRVSKVWADPAYPPRVALERELPAETGFSPEMIALGMKELCWVMDPDVLRKKVRAEFRGVPQEGEFLYNADNGSALSWSPLGVVLHVLSGNVFLVGAGSLVEGLLTGNATILKMSSGEKIFLPKLIRSIQECDTDGVVSRSIALIDYSSSQKDVIAEVKRQVDGLVVWGGEDAVKAYRNDLPARTRLVVFGPKLSIGVVTKAGVGSRGMASIAAAVADEVAIWDQNACTAPQMIFVEGEENARAAVEAIAKALAAKGETLPAGPADVHTAVEIQKWRGRFDVAEARGEGMVRADGSGVDWTVVLDRDTAIDPSPLHRTIRVVPYAGVGTLVASCESIRGYLQTVGVAAAPEEATELAQRLASVGALRILDLGQMSGGEIDDPHDGAYDLPQLVHINITRLPLPERDMTPWDVTPEPTRRKIIDAKLRSLIDVAARSPLYADRLRGVTIETVDDLPKLPLLLRGEMEQGMPPQSQALATGEKYWGGYVTRSGGSTGVPKFSVYDGEDWERSMVHAENVFRAAGLAKGDKIANCMLAGDLYGSFVSFDHINCRIGATTFAFAGKVDPELVVSIRRNFGLNAIEAIPAVLMPGVKAAKALDPEFTLEKVIFAGTPLQKSDREWLVNVLGVKRIASIIGANDGNQLAFQCRHMEGNLHHTLDDYNWIEIVDGDGKPVPDGEPGRIVITCLQKYAFPLIRYEIGDAGRLVPGRCACGRGGRRLEYLGRSDDSICLGVLNLRYRDFAAKLEPYGYSALQIVVKNDGGVDRLTVRLEIDGATGEGLNAEIRQSVVDIPKIQDNLDSGAIAEVRIEIHGLGELERNPRTGKIRQLIDERK